MEILSKSHGIHGIHGIYPMKSYQILTGNLIKSHGIHGIHGIYLSLQELCKLHYCQPNWFQRFFVFPGCLAHHAGKKGLAFTARALLSLGLSQSIANRAGFGASLWLEESILTYAPFAPSSPHPVVFCCWTFWKGASCVCTTLLLTDVLERGWARSSTHHGAKRPLWESSPRPLHFSLMF